MSAQISLPNPISQLPIFQQNGGACNHPNNKIADLMKQVIQEKSEYGEKALRGRVNVSEAVMIGGDLFSMFYLSFQGALLVKSSLAAIPAIAISTLACGCIAGAINIGVAVISLKEGLQALKNGDKRLAFRLFLDFFSLLAIGIIMILASLSLKVAALSGVGAFLGANPWFLPVLFFIITIPVMVEIGFRIRNIIKSKDLASQLNGDLTSLIRGTDPTNPFHLKPLLESDASDFELKNNLARNMEVLQSDMGFEAALETFKLMRLHVLQEATQEQMEIVKKKISEWNSAQYVRMFQQILYCAAFAVSMGALSPALNTPAFNAFQNFAMSGANLVPLYMDTFWPFKRNTPIVVPHVIQNTKES